MKYLFAVLLLAPSLQAQEAKEAAQQEVKRLAIPEKLIPKGKAVLFLLRAEGVQVYRGEKKGDDLVWAYLFSASVH